MAKQRSKTSTAPASLRDPPWTEAELTAAVLAYFEMQRKQRAGEKLVKTKVYRGLAATYPRTVKAFELRMQNISYVLHTMGRQWLTGLKPAKNVGPTNTIILERIILANSQHHHVAEPSLPYEVAELPPMPTGVIQPQVELIATPQISRDARVKYWVLQAANGYCECCKEAAPFKDKSGKPYLEVHHLVLLANGGPDTPQNTVAICPTCHRELHFGIESENLRERIYASVARLVPPAL